MNCRIGVCEWSLPVNGPGAVGLAAKAGFSGLQVGDLGGAEQGYPMNSPAIQEAYLQAAEEQHVILQSLHPYGLQRAGTMLFPTDTPQGQQGMQDVAKCIDACQAMHIPILMVSSFFATLVRNEWDLDVFAQQLRFACHYGADHGVRVVCESVLSPARILRLIEAVGEELAICYDTLNPIRWGTGDPAQEIPELIGRIDHFHVKDAPFDLKGYAPLGEGRGQFLQTANVIRSTGYSGWIISENYYTTLAAVSGRDFLSLARQDVAAIQDAFRS
ncbi:MAG: sugar phosphate isomerase/epimerase [Oscillibacter sp.]|nr:sugar phosphate isomerase/epimerase [Oscillibacter sp.]